MNNQLIFPVNEKVNYTPLVLRYTFFQVIQEDSNIKGYWKDNKGTLHVDNIRKINIPIIRKELLQGFIRQAFRDGEKALFYKNISNEAVILDNKGSETVLKNQVHILENIEPSEAYVLELLKNANGLTVYKINDSKFLIEIYK